MAAPLPQIQQFSDHWEEETLFFSGDAYFDDLLQGIGLAQETIELESYIFKEDQIGSKIVSALEAAARRGVKVRVLIDGIGSSEVSDAWFEKIRVAGISVRVFSPLPWFFSRYEDEEDFYDSFLGLGNFVSRLNRRNHRKVAIVDKTLAWVGSFNISDSHLQKYAGDKAWRDSGVKVRGPGVPWLSLAFDLAWIPRSRRRARRKLIRTFRKPKPNDLLRLNYQRKWRRRFNRELSRRMSQAQKRIWIQTPYFVPSSAQVKQLQKAAKRGVDVRIMLPFLSDVPLVQWLSMEFFQSLLRSGVKIFEFLPTVLHAKVAMIDEWATVGSCNFSSRSFIHNLEVEVVLSKMDSVKKLTEQFEKDSLQCKQVSQKNWDRRNFWKRILSKLIFKIRSWF